MRTIVILLLLGLAQLASATQLRIETVMQPLYLHGADSEPRIEFLKVPYATFAADPEWRFPAISTPFIPPADKTVPREDVNLASVYKITVEGTYKDDGKDFLVKVDASKAVRPEGYPFTVEQVIDAVVTCVKFMYPARPPEDGALEVVVTPPGQKAKVSK
ncbi:MAG: hypothetical protein ACO1QR_15715 [Chthoniobacteraceae bacterium]